MDILLEFVQVCRSRNCALSEVDNFNYLRSLLEHTAYDTIAGLNLSDTPYREAVELLKKRFGDKQLIISKHMETLLHMEGLEPERLTTSL